MKKMWVIAKKDIFEAFRSRSTYFYIAIIIVLSIIQIINYGGQIENVAKNTLSQSDFIDQVRPLLDSALVFFPLLFAIWVCTIFATYAVIVEKSKRNLESLMATPVSLKQIWLGKTLAVTIPAVIIGIIISVVIYLAFNMAYISQYAGGFVVPSAFSIVTALIIDSALVFTIVAIVVYLQLVISNPRFANFVFIGIFFVLFFGVTALVQVGVTVSLSYYYLGALIVFGWVAFLLSRFLTREKVILSSKG